MLVHIVKQIIKYNNYYVLIDSKLIVFGGLNLNGLVGSELIMIELGLFI